jgi:hypothetical protein
VRVGDIRELVSACQPTGKSTKSFRPTGGSRPTSGVTTEGLFRARCLATVACFIGAGLVGKRVSSPFLSRSTAPAICPRERPSRALIAFSDLFCARRRSHCLDVAQAGGFAALEPSPLFHPRSFSRRWISSSRFGDK